MQGKKDYQEKLFTSFRLSDRIPKENFYRRLKEALNLDFLYPLTHQFYGESGQKSIDPVVYFKICLVGYLENITTDRGVMDHCAMRLDILYFLGYDVDEELPWHSTISRTRKLFTDDVFEEVFTRVFKLCVEAGLVSGHTQAIDSAPVKANASMIAWSLKSRQKILKSISQSCVCKAAGTEKPKRTKPLKNNRKLPPVNKNYRKLRAVIKDGVRTRI